MSDLCGRWATRGGEASGVISIERHGARAKVQLRDRRASRSFPFLRCSGSPELVDLRQKFLHVEGFGYCASSTNVLSRFPRIVACAHHENWQLDVPGF